MSETQTLHFYTTGEAYTNTMVDFFRSGEFKLFEELLGDGNLNHEQKLMAFRLQMRLTGDTRTAEGLSCSFVDEEPDFNKTLYFSIMTCIRGLLFDYEDSVDGLMDLFQIDQILEHYSDEDTATTARERKQFSKLQTLLKYYSVDEIKSRCFKFASYYALQTEGYSIKYDEFNFDSERSVSGVILKDGGFVQCGYADHVNLMPILNRYGLADSGCWTESLDTIHLSSGEIGGGPSYSLPDHHYKYSSSQVTPAQVETLWAMRSVVNGMYAERESVADLVRQWSVRNTGAGGKYGNLEFLKQRFPHIRTPKTSMDFMQFEAGERVFMRTSPKKSLPGLLHSKQVRAYEDEINDAIMQMGRDYEKVKDIRPKNELHWFFQEFLSGTNGVLHVRQMPGYKYEFTYQVSSEQGAVVGGKRSTETLSPEHLEQIKTWAMEIANTLKVEGIQIEFVVDEHGPCFVQLRVLENEFEKGLGGGAPDSAFIRGKSFSNGYIEVSPAEILVVKEDAESHELIGKRALIVEADVEFSHILALSKALRIPSMYATGPVDFGGRDRFNFSTRLFEAYCNDIHKG